MSAVPIIIGYAMRESLRRRVFAVVLLLTLLSGGLYALGAHFAFRDSEGFAGSGIIDAKAFTGSTILGLAMFGTLFLGAVLAVFLTLGIVRGEAERGLLQPLVVRPLGRGTLLLARFAGAAAVSAAYAMVVFVGAVVVTGILGDWWPDRLIGPAIGLGAAVAVIASLSVLGSVFFSGTANGIAAFMVFGAGLVAGLLGQIGEALHSDTLENVAKVAAWALPFEALYQSALNGLTADTRGFTRVAVDLGPFGGAQEAGPLLGPWAVVYVGLVLGLAIMAFQRRDL
ncbi:MAG: ABC transporter permease subunit [Solirubrobacteraceae bacterium]